MTKNIILSIIALLSVGFAACGNEDELYEYPKIDVLTLSVDGYSLAGELDLLLDGEVVASGSRLKMNPQQLIADRGERRLQVRQKGRTEILKTWSFNEAGTQNITFYWNGEEFTDELVIPEVAPGNIGFLLSFVGDVVYKEPMDIEVYYFSSRGWDGDVLLVGVTEEPLALIENYTPGSGYTRFVEVRAPGGRTNLRGSEIIMFRLYKAGTREPYHTLYTQGNYHADYPDECWLWHGYNGQDQYIHDGITTFITTYTEVPGSFLGPDIPCVRPATGGIITPADIGKTGYVRLTHMNLPDF